MDFKDRIKQLAERVKSFKEKLQTEEATKTSLIMPFIQLLGYDVFNPDEVIPEMDCDQNKPKGEKIDYAIIKDGIPVMLIECKHWKQDLALHKSQLKGYFQSKTSVKFGILTNGIVYQFFTDLEDENLMDEAPFLEINLENLDEKKIDELKKFCKDTFSIDDIKQTAKSLKYMSELKTIVKRQLTEPSWDFVRLLTSSFHTKRMTQQKYEEFSGMIKTTINNYINDIMAERLDVATKIQEETQQVVIPQEELQQEKTKNKVVTTPEELEAFYIVKSILREQVPTELIKYRDYQNYFTIYIDKGYRIVARLYFYSSGNTIEIVNKDKSSTKHKIESIEEIYNFKNELLEASK